MAKIPRVNLCNIWLKPFELLGVYCVTVTNLTLSMGTYFINWTIYSVVFLVHCTCTTKNLVFIKMWIITIASSYKSSQSVMYYDVHMYYVCWYIVLIIWINDEPSVDKPCIEYISLAHYVVGTCMQVFIYRLFLLTLRTAFITLCRCPLHNIYIGTSSV